MSIASALANIDAKAAGRIILIAIFAPLSAISAITNSDKDWLIISNIALVAFCSSIYFFYLDFAAEKTIDKSLLDKKRAWNTVIVLFQYIGIGLLWFTLRSDIIYFTLNLMCLNFSYLVWDTLNWKKIKDEPQGRIMCIFDFCGSLAALGLFVLSCLHLPDSFKTISSNEAHLGYYLSLICGVLIAQSLIGLLVSISFFKVNPFKRDNYKNS